MPSFQEPLLSTHWLPSAALAVLMCWQVNWLINLLRNLPFSALSLARGLCNLSCSPFQENLPLVFRKFHLPGAALWPWSKSAPSRHPVSTFFTSGLLLLNLEARVKQTEGAPQAATYGQHYRQELGPGGVQDHGEFSSLGCAIQEPAKSLQV